MSVPTHSFCWHGISTPVEAGTAFYAGALGWQRVDSPSGPMFVAPGGAVAHIQAPEGGPPAWCSFLAVDDLDVATARAVAEGGALVVPPTDLPVGRFSVVATPSGGVFGLYQAVPEDALPTGPGTVHWVELQSADVDADLAWLGAVFGFTVRTQALPTGPYHVLVADGVSRGGVGAAVRGRSEFVAWVRVDDLDATLGEVAAFGGRAVTPVSASAVGRMAVVADPGGATFGLIEVR